METTAKIQDKSAHGTTSLDENFNFEQWAVQVRQQMMAALQKRGSRQSGL